MTKTNWKDKLNNIFKEKPTFIVFDTETTGLDAKRNKILQISAIKMTYNPSSKKYEETDRLDQYIRPTGKIPESISELTGITNEFIKTQPKEAIAFPIIQLFFEDCDLYIGHNLSFDLRFIRRLYERNDEVFPEKEVLDTYILSKDLIKSEVIENYKLATVTEYLGLDKDPEIIYHSAIGDVIATKKIFILFFAHYMTGKPLSELTTLSSPVAEKYKFSDAPANFIIDSMNYWTQNFSRNKALKRIYVRIHSIETNSNRFYGTLFYDIDKKMFFDKEKDGKTLELIDTSVLERECFNIARNMNYKTLTQFRGNFSRI